MGALVVGGGFMGTVVRVVGAVALAELASEAVESVTLGAIRAVARKFLGDPTNDEENTYINDVTRAAANILDDEGILRAKDPRNPERVPRYLTADLETGRVWEHFKYYSKKSVNAQWKRGRNNGEMRERRRLQSEAAISSEGSH